MKKRLSKKSFMSSFGVWFALILTLCALTLTVGAENTLTEASMTYDFQSYASVNDASYKESSAANGGWHVSGAKPNGATGQTTVASTMGAVGFYDRVTREGNGIYENILLTYVVPEKDRIAIKDYSAIKFTRWLYNAPNFARAGAVYEITLVMDDSQTITLEFPWIDLVNGMDEAEVSAYIWDEVAALEGDPTLVEIQYKPYCNVDDFNEEYVVSGNSIVQFLTKYMVFEKAFDKPNLSSETDTWDGVSVVEHNGKITELDPAVKYEYKLTYATEWISVPAGSTEISGLVGAAYRVRVAADTERGILASEPAVVNVPKTTSTPFSYRQADFSAGNFKASQTSDSVIGYWTSTRGTPYNDGAGNLTRGIGNPGVLNGTTTLDGGSKFRKLEYSFNYTCTPEEQIEISKASFKFSIKCAMNFPYLSYEEVSGVMKVYVSSLDEPIMLSNLQHSSGAKPFTYNLATLFPDVDGYIERIEYFPCYEQLSEAINTNSYPQITDVYAIELKPAPAPNLFTVDMGDNLYKILGFVPYNKYQMSYDGEVWEDLPDNASSVEVTEIGEYYFRQKEDSVMLSGAATKVVIKSKRSAPEGLTVNGKTVLGLNKSLVYEYAPYALGADLEYTEISGVESISGLSSGLWTIRLVEDGENFASDSAYFFVDGSSSKGKVNLTAQTTTSAIGFVAGELSSDVRQVSKYKDGAYAYDKKVFIMYSGWTKTTNMEINSELNYTYSFTSEQVFDIKQLYSFTTRCSFQGSGLYLNNGSLTGFQNKLRIYVLDSDVEYYDVLFPWNSISARTINIADLLPANAHGYVTGYKFYFYGAWPEISSEMKSGQPYPFFYVYDMTLRTKVASPKPTVSYVSGGTFSISGLSSSYLHGYSTDGVNFVELPSGTTSFNVSTPGTYYVYAENSSGMKSDVVAVEVVYDGAYPTTGLSVSRNSIVGFDTKRPYEYRKYSLAEENEYIAVPEGTATLKDLEAGLWEVRYASATGTPAEPQYLLIGGNYQGSISYKALYLAGGDADDGERGFVAGRWTSSSSKAYLDYVGNDSFIRFATGWTSSIDEADREAMYFSYQFTDDEIIPASQMGQISLSAAFSNACPFSKNDFSIKVRYYVAGSNVEYYDEILTPSSYQAYVNSDLSKLAENDLGYVVGIRIWPFAVLSDGTTLTTSENRYPVLRLKTTVDSNEDDVRLRYRVVFAQTKPLGLKLVEEELNLFQRYKITGLDPTKSYEYSYNYNGMSYTAVSAGSTEIAGLVGGKYYVRYAGQSEAVVFITPDMTPAFLSQTISKYPKVGSPNPVEGVWACYPSTFGTQDTPASYVAPTTVFNTVQHIYTFHEEHRFTVAENPIFTFDFSNEMSNFGYNTFIEGAVAKVEINFVGRDEPLVIEKEWVDKPIVNGATGNKIVQNLLELDPTVESLTVESFTIRPYSNLTTTPNSYNTTAEKDRSVYFQLINVGFFSTPANVGALTSADHAQVNTFEGISVETIPESVKVGDVIDQDKLVVKALYSDGTYTVLDHSIVSFNIPTFEKSGIYTASVTYRGKSVEKTVYADVDITSLEVLTLPTKTVYSIGQMFDASGLTLVYTTLDGYTVVVDSGFEVDAVLFDSEGEKTITVSYAGTTLEFTVKVLADGSEIELSEDSEYTIDQTLKLLLGVAEKTSVANLLTNFANTVTVFDRTGAEIEDFETSVGTGFRVVTYNGDEIADELVVIVKGDVNGNGTIDTNDYMLVKRACLGTVNLSEGSAAHRAADVNGTGILDSNDYLQVKNHYRGRVDLFN